MKSTKYKVMQGIALLILMASLLVSFYPAISDYYYKQIPESTVTEYEKVVDTATKEEVSKYIKEARAYNRKLYEDASTVSSYQGFDEEKYQSILSEDGNPIMGRVRIPSIDVDLPIYHDSPGALEKGAAHIKGSSFPVGGKSTHAVISAHTGSAKSRFFTDLVEVEKGDRFFIDIYGKNLCYEVDKIKVVLPDDISDLEIKEGKDRCTLVTCTPYGVNSHRLLVRGSRVKMKDVKIQEVEKIEKEKKTDNVINERNKMSYITLLIVILVIVLSVGTRKGRR